MQPYKRITIDCCGFCKHFKYAEEEYSYCGLVDEEDDSRYDIDFFCICELFERDNA